MAERAVARLQRLRARAGTVRVRTTTLATLVVGVALLLGAIALVMSLQAILTREVQRAADLRATELAGLLESGAQPRTLADTDTDAQLVQILGPNGEVVASSPLVAGQPAVARPGPGERARIRVSFDDDEFLAVAATAGTAEGTRTVVVARSLGTVAESTQTVAALLAVGLPIILLMVAGTTWRVVGRALAPVDAIRREVDEISATQLHRRVPQPSGGDEVARLAGTMNRMLHRLHQAQARQCRFVSDASHELRSPVAVVRQHAEVALAHPRRTTVDQLAGTVLAESLRLQRLVEDLLLLARADERTLALHRRPVDLDDLVFDEARRLRTTAPVTVDTTAVSAGPVDGDAAALRRMLRNIADNAIHHARSRVALSLAERDGWVVLNVDDDGPGIAAEDRARLFERFVRLDGARSRDAGGAGLGLAIVAELAAVHGGGASVTESPLGGARFTVRLPSRS